MKLYDYTLAPNPKRVRIFLAEKGITVPTVQVDLRGGEQFTPEFRAINPECTVPVLNSTMEGGSLRSSRSASISNWRILSQP
jgi:glutathione S-transferase